MSKTHTGKGSIGFRNVGARAKYFLHDSKLIQKLGCFSRHTIKAGLASMSVRWLCKRRKIVFRSQKS